MKKRDRCIILSNRAIIDHKHKKESGIESKLSPGGVSQAFSNIVARGNSTFVCMSDGPHDLEYIDENKKEELPSGGFQKKIFLTNEEKNKYYNKIANSVLWPVYHGLLGNVENFNLKDWHTYVRTNMKFAQNALEEQKNGMVWANDYQLAMVPLFIENSGYFHHIPFEINDNIRNNTMVEKIIIEQISSMLCSKLVGFHVPKYVHNFLENVKKYFPEAEIKEKNKEFRVENKGKVCCVKDFPISIDTKFVFDNSSKEKKIQYIFKDGKKLEDIVENAKSSNLKIIAGVDRLDYTKGIIERLDIFEKLLEKEENLYLIQIGAPTRQGIRAYDIFRKKVKETVDRINKKFLPKLGYEPIFYREEAIDNKSIFCLFRDADIVTVTPIIDGMNLMVKEAIASKKSLQRNKRGFVVLGKNAGAAYELERFANDKNGLVIVDPLNKEAAAELILKTLHNPKNKVSDKLINYIYNNDLNKWTTNYLGYLRYAVESNQRLTQMKIYNIFDYVKEKKYKEDIAKKSK